MALTDYLAAEPLIVARLRDTLGSLVKAVLSAADLPGVAEASQATPAVHVYYDGDTPGDAESDTTPVDVQRWLVVVVVRAVNDLTGAAARQEAGPLMRACIQALRGHKLSADLGRLKRVRAPKPLYQNGFAYLPLAFENTVLVENLNG